MTLKKAYYYFYYNIYIFFINISDDALNKFKPVIIIGGLEISILTDFFNWYSILTKNDAAILPYFLGAIFLALFNTFVFLHGNKYKKYFPEFQNYSKKKKVIGGSITFLIIILVIASLIFSFHQMDLIYWKIYRYIIIIKDEEEGEGKK